MRALVLMSVLGGCWWATPPAAPAAPPPEPYHLPATAYMLGNGLRVVIVQEPLATTVSVTVRYHVGDADDPTGRDGTAHLLEHTLYEQPQDGTSLFDALDATALEFNGRTMPDATVYTATAEPDQLPAILALEASRLHRRCAGVTEAAFERQREIVRNELREREDFDRVIGALQEAMFPVGHPYHRAGAGTADSVAGLTREAVCAFADVFYMPNNASIVVSGPLAAATVQAAVEAAFGRIGGRAPEPLATEPITTHRAATVAAPVERPLVVLGWPLPADPVKRTRVRAIGQMIAPVVSARVNARVDTLELGAGSARILALVLEPSEDISPADAIRGARRAFDELPAWFESGLFEQARGIARTELLMTLEAGVDRDIELAEEVMNGRDIVGAFDTRLGNLAAMSRDDARFAANALAFRSATIVTLQPGSHAHASVSGLAASVHEEHRRSHADPADARQPSAKLAEFDPYEQVHVRTLPSGLRVVLMPMSDVPIVDIDLVFDAGTGDEPANARGVALIAGHALHAPDTANAVMDAFVRAGGAIDVDVDRDHTAFRVAGASNAFHQLLAGLATTVRAGVYDSASSTIEKLERHPRTPSKLAARIAWRGVLYGPEHPYTRAGLWELHGGDALDGDVVRAFRTVHFQPDRATLIVAGGFSPVEVDRWIEEDLGTWTGHGRPHAAHAARFSPAALAQEADSSQIELTIAMPMSSESRAAAEIAAEMVRQALADVREQLGATYGLSGALDVSRAASLLTISGNVDAARTAEAFAMLTDRLAKLHTPSDDTAMLFVTARRGVLARLATASGHSSELARLAIDDVDLGRTPGSEGAAAEQARATTLDQVLPLLHDVDVLHAAMFLRGPRAAVTTAYAAIGRPMAWIK